MTGNQERQRITPHRRSHRPRRVWLPNRRRFHELLGHAVSRLNETGDPHDAYAVMFLDFDRFKLINDSLGHAVGDEFLAAVARRIQHQLRAATPNDAKALKQTVNTYPHSAYDDLGKVIGREAAAVEKLLQQVLAEVNVSFPAHRLLPYRSRACARRSSACGRCSRRRSCCTTCSAARPC